MKLPNLKFVTVFIVYLTVVLSCGKESDKNYSDVDNASVYVCMGGYAKRYHATEYCRGLMRCRGDVVEMSIEEAEESGKTSCKMCY